MLHAGLMVNDLFLSVKTLISSVCDIYRVYS